MQLTYPDSVHSMDSVSIDIGYDKLTKPLTIRIRMGAGPSVQQDAGAESVKEDKYLRGIIDMGRSEGFIP